jgi:hypothetical protein
MSPRELPWPCPNVLPGMAPVAAVLARTEQTVVAVTGIRAYPAGFGFMLHLRLRDIDAGRAGSSGPSTSSARRGRTRCYG